MRYNYEKRSMGYIIDMVVAAIIAILVVVLVPAFDNQHFLSNLTDAVLIYSICFFIYAFVCYYFFNGFTIGRYIFKTALRNKDLSKMSLTTCMMRALLQAFIPFTLLNVVYMLMNKSEESFFDKATDTTSIFL